MNTRTLLISLAGLIVLSSALPARAADVDKYLWETPRATNIDRAKAAPLIAELSHEVQLILDSPPLGPLRCAYADIPFEAYYLYFERGRIITTLAWAYPHVAPDQQTAIKAYVNKLLKDEDQAPWNPGMLDQKYGAERRLYKTPMREGRYVDFDKKSIPTVHTFYGLWLYGDRTGDWDAIKANWAKIKARYAQAAARDVWLYGQMSAHIAMARMARQFDDADTQKAAEAALAQDFATGADPAKIEERMKKTQYSRFFDRRAVGSFPGMCFMFLDASPEVLRYIGDVAREPAVRRVGSMTQRYPLWWLHQAPYGPRWTGDEGKGTPPDCVGMIYPIERWVKQTPAAELSLCMRSTPTGIGDSYWLESLAQTIEAFGQTKWEPVGR